MRKIKHNGGSKGTKDKIIELFFEKHLKPVDISKKLDVKSIFLKNLTNIKNNCIIKHRK